jgi:predicted TIM-barrel fold metal-dependent hydrolase
MPGGAGRRRLDEHDTDESRPHHRTGDRSGVREVMAFHREPGGYEKTILSDLQGAWENLLDDVVAAHPFPDSERILFHIHEGMSWESVRDLDKMKAALLLVKNLAAKKSVPSEIKQSVDDVWEILDEVLAEIAAGKRL